MSSQSELPASSQGPAAVVAGGDFPLIVQYAHALELFVPARSQVVPPAAILPLVAGNVFFERVERPVWGGVGDVHEERRIAFSGLAYHLHGVVADGVGKVEVVQIVERDEGFLVHQRLRVVEVSRSGEKCRSSGRSRAGSGLGGPAYRESSYRDRTDRSRRRHATCRT